VLGPNSNPINIFKDRARSFNCPVHLVERKLSVNAENTAVAEAIVRILSSKWNGSLADIQIPCRFEKVTINGEASETACTGNDSRQSSPKTVIFDAAHNPDAFSRLRIDLMSSFPSATKFAFVIAMSDGKDVRESLNQLLMPECDGFSSRIHSVCFTRGQNEGRIMDPSVLRDCLNSFSMKRNDLTAIVEKNPMVAVESTFTGLPHSTVMVVCGTFFLMNAAKLSLNLIRENEMDNVEMNEQNI